jgi:hypothetical protein
LTATGQVGSENYHGSDMPVCAHSIGPSAECSTHLLQCNITFFLHSELLITVGVNSYQANEDQQLP